MIPGRDPARWRLDAVGNPVLYLLRGCHGTLCHEYDHIMPIVGYKKDKKENTLGLYYNDLYDVSKARYVSAETDIMDREECEAEEDEEQKYCIPKETVCAIAIKGHMDTASVL